MSVSFAIMAHPSRIGHVEAMLARLVEQGAVNVPVAVDNDRRGAWETAKRAWNMYNPKATHHVVLQDDISFGPDFVSSAADYLPPTP